MTDAPMTRPSREELDPMALADELEHLRLFKEVPGIGMVELAVSKKQTIQSALRRPAILHGEGLATPQQVQEACAQVADRAAERFGDQLAREIAKSIRALIPPAALPVPPLDREGIARIIDPAAFHGAYLSTVRTTSKDKALAKTDAILALLSPASGGTK
jgi:hypothetical protein